MMEYYARWYIDDSGTTQDFKIIELPNLMDSSRETKFSDIQVDFRTYDESYLPIQYQEIKIIQIDESATETELYTAYAEGVDYPEFKFDDQPFFLTINLLSPYAYASKRSISTQINAVALNTAIETILDPLIDDGFTIEENNLSTKEVSEIFQSETVEKVMNYLAQKFNFVWYIDKNKKIYLKDIDTLIGQEPVLSITDTERHYLQSIKPIKTVVDYANRLNIKNVKLISGYFLIPENTVLVEGESYMFTYPFSVSENVCYRLTDGYSEFTTDNIALWIKTNKDGYMITIDTVAKSITYDAAIGFAGVDDDDATKKILLVTDVTDNTKIVGFRWVASSETVNFVLSNTTIVPYLVTYIDPVEISKIKNKLSTSGVIEKIIDANGKYFTGEELQNFAVSKFSQNNVQTDEIRCTFKGRLNDSDFLSVINSLIITKTFSIELNDFNISGNYIITDRSYSANTQTATLKINARNYNLNENFLDVFRVKMEEEAEDFLTRKQIVFYNQDEKTIVGHQVIVNGEVVSDV